MFTKEYYFKYSDLDNKGNVKVSTVVDLLQDISIFHSAQVGYDLKKMKELSLAMLLHGWRIHFYEDLKYDLPATFKTGIMKIHRCEVIRRYEIIQEGKVKVAATAEWFSLNTEKMSVIRVPEEINSTYDCVSEEDNNLPVLKLRPECGAKEFAQTAVTRRDLDTNNHMNNVKSVEVALDYLPEDYSFSRLHVIYQKQLHRDDIIRVFTKSFEDGYALELRNGKGEPCVLLRVDK